MSKPSGGDTGSEVRGITIFQEEYEYWKKQGLSHVCAQNKAIDYYRKFTSREVTHNWDLVESTIADEGRLATEDVISFNQLVAQLIDKVPPKERKFLFLLIKQQDLDQHLNEENAKLCEFYTGNASPEKMYEVAALMGFSCQASGSSISANNYKHRLREYILSLNLR